VKRVETGRAWRCRDGREDWRSKTWMERPETAVEAMRERESRRYMAVQTGREECRDGRAGCGSNARVEKAETGEQAVEAMHGWRGNAWMERQCMDGEAMHGWRGNARESRLWKQCMDGEAETGEQAVEAMHGCRRQRRESRLWMAVQTGKRRLQRQDAEAGAMRRRESRRCREKTAEPMHRLRRREERLDCKG